MKAEKQNWVRVRVKKPKAYQHMPLTATRLVNLPTGTGKIFMLPLRPEPMPKPKPDTEYPALPFTRETDLEEQVIKLLETVPDYYTHPNFSIIPAIKHVRTVMSKWDLMTSKEYVEKIYKNNLDKITAARVISLKSWKGPTE